MEIRNKLAIVTGGNKGIGKATTLLLLENDVKVAVWSRTKPQFTHANLEYFFVDISEEVQVIEAYQKTVAHFQQSPDILINNAGIGHMAPIEETSAYDWKRMFDVNVKGLFYVSKEVIPDMKKKEAGHIINISSIAGLNGVKNLAGYVGTKHAVRGISHSMFFELRDFGIKVSCVYPGSTKTNFFDNVEGMDAHDNMMMPEDIAKSIVQLLETSDNYAPVDLEIRPLKPKG